MRLAANDGKPILGICRGAQVMNVALGGTLYTHVVAQLPGAIEHE
jgi:putative glutamine amidotransferase